MNPELLRAGILLGLAVGIGAGIAVARWRIGRRRARVLATAPTFDLPASGARSAESNSVVRILAFSSKECVQCHRLQAPAIQRVLAARGPAVAMVEVDAPSSPELTERYRILTLPSTAILDAAGKVHAINYGFADSTKLLRQVDALLASNMRADVVA
jgi:hypothetical protein